jgi:hypothetical protein
VHHIDPGGQARFTHRRVDGDGMIRWAGGGRDAQVRARDVPDRAVSDGGSGALTVACEHTLTWAAAAQTNAGRRRATSHPVRHSVAKTGRAAA